MATELISIQSGRLEELRGRLSKLKTEQIKIVESEFREYGSILTLAMRRSVVQREGELARSVGYKVFNAGTKDIELRVTAGNKLRPEVVVRSNLFGRRGFSARPGKVLAFEIDGQLIFTKRVRAARGNNWMQRGWEQTATQRRSMIGRIGRLIVETITK